MKAVKGIILFLIAGIIMMGVFGCMKNANSNQAEKVRELAHEYLNGKYDDNFVAKGYSKENWAYNYATVTFASEKYVELLIEVRVYKNEDGTYCFEDNYFRCTMEPDAIEYLEGILGIDSKNIKIRFSGATWSDDLAGAQKFIDWKNQGTCSMDVYVLTESELSEERRNVSVNAIANERICGCVNFYVTKEVDVVTGIDIDEVLNNQSKFIQSKTEYYINSDFKVEKVN